MKLLKRSDYENYTTEQLCHRFFESYIGVQFPSYRFSPHNYLIADKLQALESGEIRRLMIMCPPRHGKLLSDFTDLPTTIGWRKHGDLKIGDYVYGPDGKKTKVIWIAPKSLATLEVEFTNGEKIKCHENHEWTVWDRAYEEWKTYETKYFIKTTKFGKKKQLCSGNRFMYQLPLINPLEFQEQNLPMHPYALGVWLGDGQSKEPRICASYSDEIVLRAVSACGYQNGNRQIHNVTGVIYQYYKNGMMDELKDLDLISNKHIPEIYKLSSIEQRLELLAGLIDSDGSVDKAGRVRIVTADPVLAYDIKEIVRSFGWHACHYKQSPCTSSSGIIGKKEVSYIGFQPSLKIPTRVPRKEITRLAPQRRFSIKSVTECDPEPGNSIGVDRPDGLYLVGKTLIPTHNTMQVSEFFPAWYLGRNPSHQVIAATYSYDRAGDVGRKVRNQMIDPVHKAVFPDCTISTDSKGANKFATEQGGQYYSVGVGGAIVGRGANCVSGDTKIFTEYGNIKIKKLVDMIDKPRVLSLGEDGLSFNSVIATRKKNSDDIYTVKTSSGCKIKTTGEHKFYIYGQGYTKAKDLQPGHKIVTENKTVYNLQRKAKSSFSLERFMSKLLQQTSEKCFKNRMPILSQNISKKSMRHPEISQTWTQRFLLFIGLLKKTSCNKKSQKMHCLWISNIKENYEILFKTMQKTFFNKSIIAKSLQALWKNFQSKIKSQLLLFKELSKYCTFNPNAWKKQFALQKRKQLFKIVQGNETSYSYKRSESMRSLYYKKETQWKKDKHGCSPYRRDPFFQSPGELDHTLHDMSCNSSQIKFNTISRIEKNSNRKIDVYDIQVERNSNFFANSILVHNCFIIDDPIKSREDAESLTARRKLIEWFKAVAFTRLMPDNRIVIIMTRWHFDDLVGRILDEGKEKWDVVSLPAIAEDNDQLKRKPGEALWSSDYPVKTLENIKQSIGSREWNSQYQQRPLDEEGGMIKLGWFKRYDEREIIKYEVICLSRREAPTEKPFGIYKIVLSWDTAFKESELNDPSSCTIWGISADGYYLLYVFNKRMGFPTLKRHAIRIYDRYMKYDMGSVAVLIEDRASGQSLIQVLEAETRIPIIPIRPDSNKVIRTDEVSPIMEAGHVHLPENAPWLIRYETQMAQFPLGREDDDVDSTTQFLRWVSKPRYKRSTLSRRFWK